MNTSARPPKIPRPTPVPRVAGPLDGLDAEAALMWWAGRPMPDVVPFEDGSEDDLVTFCWHDGEADQVLLWANRLADETDLAATLLERVPGTGLWHASYRMPSQWRASYCFLPAGGQERPAWLGEKDQVVLRQVLDRGLPDPRNPTTCRNRAGVEQSVVSGSAAPAQPWSDVREEVPRGLLRRCEVAGRDAWLHVPAGVPDDEPLPVLVVLDGDVWTSSQDLPTTLDNLHADGVATPRRTLMLGSGGRDHRWGELGDAKAGVDLVVEVAVPWLRSTLPVLEGPSHVGVAGQSLGGMTALRVGLRAPEVVGTVLSQSASTWQDDLSTELDVYASHRAPRPLRVHLSHGSQEWVLAPGHAVLAQRLHGAGVDVRDRTYCGGHDYAWWRGAVPDAIVELDALDQLVT